MMAPRQSSDVVVVASHNIRHPSYVNFSPGPFWKPHAIGSSLVAKASLQCSIPVHPGFPTLLFTLDWKPSGFSPEGFPLFIEHILVLHIYYKDIECSQFKCRFEASDLAGPETLERLFELQ